MRRIALVLAVVGACGDNLADPAITRSGSRLKLAYWEYPDGTRQLATDFYYDSELATRCTPAVFSDGNRYCAPTTDEAVFVNDTCTRALGRTAAVATPAPYFTTQFYLAGKPLPSRVFRRGNPTLAPVTIYEKHSNACIARAPDDFEYFELASEVTDLVRLHRSPPRGGDTLAIVDEVSDDGLHVPVGFYDRELDVSCTPAEHANADSVECVPDDSVLASYFSEVGCTEPIIALSGADSVPSTAKDYSALSRCWSYYAVGDELAAPALYEALGGTCKPAEPPSGYHFYATAGPRQTQGLLRMRETTDRRLARIWRMRGELRLEDPLLYDQQLATECRRLTNGVCMPVTDATVLSFYSDFTCTTPLALAIVPAGSCDPWVPFAKLDDTVVRLGPQAYTDTIWWLSTGDTCGFYGPPAPFVAWSIGATIDPATFPRAELVIDP